MISIANALAFISTSTTVTLTIFALSMQEFYTHQGEWFETFSEPLLEPVSGL